LLFKGGLEVRLSGEFHRNYFAILFCGCFLFAQLANADIAEITNDCNGCHGTGGVSTESDVPSIAGISQFILEEYMFEYRHEARICRESRYRSGDLERPATDMCVIAKDLSEDDISAIAEHYGDKEFVAAVQDFDADIVAVGAKLHKKLCKKCHSDGGSYADDDASILAGQWIPYFEQVFSDYANGDRQMLDDKMKEKVDPLSDEDINALIHFYGSQQ
jgi:sulfide dehydrogenase cytochrome subunit